MTSRPIQWQKLGKVIQADGSIPWLHSHTGACSVLPMHGKSDEFLVFLTGRDKENRSMIGRGALHLSGSPQISPELQPTLEPGELGAFDENGVSYPWVVQANDRYYMYYTGWMPTVKTPFQNHLGLATGKDGRAFSRHSRAPILARTNEEPFSIGSVAVLAREDHWQMWYTCFLGWGKRKGEPKHRYVIKHATSTNGLHWERANTICIDSAYGWDHSIGRPSVYYDGATYHMWFSYRGDSYRIGYAQSSDGVTWHRDDELAGISPSPTGWDSTDQCYPFVFEGPKGRLFMLYCGNNYGDGGIGIAVQENSAT